MKSVSRKRLYLLSAHMQIKRLSETLCSVIWLAETIWNARNVVETQTLCHDFKTHPKRINGQEKRNRYCNDHKLCIFFKMKHNLTPTYLSAPVPHNVSNTTRYRLRNSNDLQTTTCKLYIREQLYTLIPFLPSTVEYWNSLSPEGRQIDTVDTFIWQAVLLFIKQNRYLIYYIRYLI